MEKHLPICVPVTVDIQGPHHQRHVKAVRPNSQCKTMGHPGRGHRLPQPGQLRIREQLLGYHNNSRQK